MTDSDLNTLRQGGEKIQQVEFESLYTGLHEVREISKLQKKLELTEGEQKNGIPLLKSLKAYEGGSYSCLWNFNRRSIVENYKTKYSLVFPFLSQLKVYEYYNNSYIYFNIQNDSKDFFKIKKCFEDNNNNYIFISNSGCIFTAKKEDFNSAGYMATSLKLISIPQGLGMGITNISDDDGTIKYYLNGNLEGTLQGQCFTYVNKSNNNDVIYVGNKSYIYKSTLIKTKDSITNKDIISHNEEDAIDLGLGEIKKITLDPKQNLLFVVSEDSEGNSNLHILDHKKIFNNNPPVVHEIKTIAGVSDVTILPDGDILLFKSDGKLDILNTNLNSLDDTVQGSFEMKKIKVNKAMNHTKKSVIDSLGTTSISIDNNKVSNEGSEEDIKIIERIRERPIEYNGTSKKLKEWLNDASSEEDIEMVKKAFLEIIKSNSNLNSVPDLLKQIEKEISNKKNEIVLNSIFSELSIITEELGGDSDLITLFTIKENLRNIQKKRKNIAAGVIAKDKELKELLELVDEKIDKYQELHKEQLETDIESNLEKIKEFLDNVENAIDISTIYTTSIYKATEEMINYLNTEGQTRFKKKLKEIVQNRGKKIKEKSDKAKKEEADMIEHRKKDIEDNIAQIKEILEEIDDINTVETYKENDVFVKKTKDLLSELPSSDAQKLDIKLDRIFSERIFKLRLGGEESKGVIQNLDSYGIDTILYYNEDGTEKIEWKIEGRENANGTIGLVAKLMNGETHEYNKGIYLKDAEKFDTVVIGDNAPKFDMTFEEFAKFNKKLSKYKRSGKEELKELSKKIQNENDPTIKEKLKKEFDEKKEYYKDARYTEALIYRLIKQQKLNPRSKVPPFDPNYIVLDEEREILKELSARLVDQKQNSSIEILEGGPGLGKTVMCEFLANVTNREIIRVQCSKMDPSDMFFSPTLKKGETSREPADWIKLMQKPGTIILFDEIDKLNDQCFERLHSLFDRGRSVYDPQLGSIKANQDCLFIGTCNSYDKLSNPILSRGRILEITYPGELNEAFKISKYSTSAVLKKMSYEEFEMLYDKYITRGEPSPTNAQEKSIYELIQNINHLLNIFNKLRELYGEDDPFPYELSYRDARQIFVDYNNSKNFKIAMEHVLIPKAKKTVIDPDEKKTRESIIRQVINGEIN